MTYMHCLWTPQTHHALSGRNSALGSYTADEEACNGIFSVRNARYYRLFLQAISSAVKNTLFFYGQTFRWPQLLVIAVSAVNAMFLQSWFADSDVMCRVVWLVEWLPRIFCIISQLASIRLESFSTADLSHEFPHWPNLHTARLRPDFVHIHKCALRRTMQRAAHLCTAPSSQNIVEIISSLERWSIYQNGVNCTYN